MISSSVKAPPASCAATIASRKFSGASRSSGVDAKRARVCSMNVSDVLWIAESERSRARSAGRRTQRQ